MDPDVTENKQVGVVAASSGACSESASSSSSPVLLQPEPAMEAKQEPQQTPKKQEVVGTVDITFFKDTTSNECVKIFPTAPKNQLVQVFNCQFFGLEIHNPNSILEIDATSRAFANQHQGIKGFTHVREFQKPHTDTWVNVSHMDRTDLWKALFELFNPGTLEIYTRAEFNQVVNGMVTDVVEKGQEPPYSWISKHFIVNLHVFGAIAKESFNNHAFSGFGKPITLDMVLQRANEWAMPPSSRSSGGCTLS